MKHESWMQVLPYQVNSQGGIIYVGCNENIDETNWSAWSLKAHTGVGSWWGRGTCQRWDWRQTAWVHGCSDKPGVRSEPGVAGNPDAPWDGLFWAAQGMEMQTGRKSNAEQNASASVGSWRLDWSFSAWFSKESLSEYCKLIMSVLGLKDNAQVHWLWFFFSALILRE